MKATLLYPYDERIVTLFAPEDKAFNRAQYTLHKQGNELIFSVEATDATAMRAALNAITKVLSVYETTLSHGAARTADD